MYLQFYAPLGQISPATNIAQCLNEHISSCSNPQSWTQRTSEQLGVQTEDGSYNDNTFK